MAGLSEMLHMTEFLISNLIDFKGICSWLSFIKSV